MLLKKTAWGYLVLVICAASIGRSVPAVAENVAECKDCKTQNQPGGSLGDLAAVAAHVDPDKSCIQKVTPNDQKKLVDEVSGIVAAFYNGEITHAQQLQKLEAVQRKYGTDPSKRAEVNALIQTALAKGLETYVMPIALGQIPGQALKVSPEQQKIFTQLGVSKDKVGALLDRYAAPYKKHLGYLMGADVLYAQGKGWSFPPKFNAQAWGWNKGLVAGLDAIGLNSGTNGNLGTAITDLKRTKMLVVGDYYFLPPKKSGQDAGDVEVLTREQFNQELGKIDVLTRQYVEQGKARFKGGFFDSAKVYKEGTKQMVATMDQIRDWKARMKYSYGVDDAELKKIDEKIDSAKDEYLKWNKAENTKFMVNIGITWAEGVATFGTLAAAGGLMELVGEAGFRHLAASQAAKAAGKAVARQVVTKAAVGAALGVGLEALKVTVDAGVKSYYFGGSFVCREIKGLAEATPQMLMSGVMFAALAPVGELAGGLFKGGAAVLRKAPSEAAIRNVVGSAEVAMMAFFGDGMARGAAVGGVECRDLMHKAGELARKGEDYVKAGKVETWNKCSEAVETAVMYAMMMAPHVKGQVRETAVAKAVEPAKPATEVRTPAAGKAEPVPLDSADRIAAKLAESVAPQWRAAVQASVRDAMATMSSADRARLSEKLASGGFGVTALADIAANPKAEYSSRRASIRAIEQVGEAKSRELIQALVTRTDDVAGSRLAALALKDRAKSGDSSAIELLSVIARDSKAEPRTRLIANQAVESATGKPVLKSEELKAQINPELQARVREEAAQIAQADQRMRKEGMTDGERSEIRRELEEIYSRQNQQIKAEEMDRLFNQAVDECL